MPRLYLLRHGIAESEGNDPPLSEEGEIRMAREAAGMARLGLTFDLILTSPLQRARRTGRIVAEGLGLDGAVSVGDEVGPGLRLPSLCSALAARGDHARGVLLVGHQPDLGRLAAELMRARAPIPFGRGTLACFESAAWPPAPPCALVFLLPAEMLEKIG